MDRFQRNAGTAGLVGGVVLIVLFAFFFTLGVPPADLGKPDALLAATKAKSGQIAAIGILSAVTSALGIIFAAGLASRLRDRAPTRATAQLYFAVVGLAAFSLDGMIRWIGGTKLAQAADAVAATNAYAAIDAVGVGLTGFGNGFVGVSLLLVGWAIIGTGALSAALGWVAVIAGIVTLISTPLPAASPVFLASGLLTIVWLLWGGYALRKAAT
jgi:hypothetical protein